jgi:Bacterial protein of unknown function (DUF853)
VKAASETFRTNPTVEVAKAITELAVGEALVSFLDENGTPGMVERAFVCPHHSQIGAITSEQRQQLINNSVVAGVYEAAGDRSLRSNCCARGRVKVLLRRQRLVSRLHRRLGMKTFRG